MMGTKERRFGPLSMEASLEDLVPDDNFYRRSEAARELSFVRDLVSSPYANGCSPSVDLVIFFKLQLMKSFKALGSEMQLVRVVCDCLSLRWYLSYDLNEPLPDHSSLNRIRKRFGLEVLRRFFERIIKKVVQAGLVRGKELFFGAQEASGSNPLSPTQKKAVVCRENSMIDRRPQNIFGVFVRQPCSSPSKAPETMGNA